MQEAATNQSPALSYVIKSHHQHALAVSSFGGDNESVRNSLDAALEAIDLQWAQNDAESSFSAHFILIKGYLDTAEVAANTSQPPEYVQPMLDTAVVRTRNLYDKYPSLSGHFMYRIADAAHRSGQSSNYVKSILQKTTEDGLNPHRLGELLKQAQSYGLDMDFSRKLVKQAHSEWFDGAMATVGFETGETTRSTRKLLKLAKVTYELGGEQNRDLIPDMIMDGSTIAGITGNMQPHHDSSQAASLKHPVTEEVENLASLALLADSTDQPEDFVRNLLRQGTRSTEKIIRDEPVEAITNYSLLAQVGVELDMIDIAQDAAARGVAIAYFRGNSWRKRHQRLQRALRGVDERVVSETFMTRLGIQKRPHNYAFINDQF